ncbi:MAG: helicase-related protein [Phototrophicales bacterium]|nr:helicase-related protein [Phototrophicales bacterium]
MTSKLQPTPQLLTDIVVRVPEGFIRRSTLNKRIKMGDKNKIDPLLDDTIISRMQDCFYDATRMSPEQVEALNKWCAPSLPHIHKDGHLPEATIQERLDAREQYLQSIGNPTWTYIITLMNESAGYMVDADFPNMPEVKLAIEALINKKILRRVGSWIYDPLRLSDSTLQSVAYRQTVISSSQTVTAYLTPLEGQTALYDDLVKEFGESLIDGLIARKALAQFSVRIKAPPYNVVWVRLAGASPEQAREIAESATLISDEEWFAHLETCGDVVRHNAKEGKTFHSQVLARSYTIKSAQKRLAIHQSTLERAIKAGVLTLFTDPEGTRRIPAHQIETALQDPDVLEAFFDYEEVRIRDLALVSGRVYETIRRRLQRDGINPSALQWWHVRGKWGLPATFGEYVITLQDKIQDLRDKKDAEAEELRLRLEEEREAEKTHRQELREKLLAAFPAWQHEYRNEQHISLHIGPPNSGKTHNALKALAEAGTGWYLAPLRLLAFEIFDRLNNQGIFCNLLTGEEHIEIPGATITAATIEMFNANQSGECVVIDEAQMLADADRGWAWTQALMQAQSPEIHVIGPATSRGLIESLANAAAIPYTVYEHNRLMPIEVSDRPWEMTTLPKQTILVAFSRTMVLHLKTELEQMKRRVSVVYGNLPPEVRRKQADRFANGETEICIATDAVGMGLNLPADHVCFYEIEKYDGKETRFLNPTEVQQIGGRAGRFGLSEGGTVGAISHRALKYIRKAFHEEPLILTHARVAPSVEDLDLIPGSLAQRLIQWSQLQSIPETLRDRVKTADLSERIELARMLTDDEVLQIGLDSAVRLTNSPTRKGSRAYWRDCATAIMNNLPMPLPPYPPAQILTSHDLERIEACVSCADIYLWLSQRQEFMSCAPDAEDIRELRGKWSVYIDMALVQRIDTAKRCSKCGKPLSPRYRYSVCESCYQDEFGAW